MFNVLRRTAGPVSGFLPASAPPPFLTESSSMRLSKSKKGGVRAVGNLSSRATRNLVPISLIAKKHKISPKFLSQIAAELKKAGILVSREGKFGGYTLAKSAGKIKILDVLRVLDGELVEGKCFEDDQECTCGAGEMWNEMKTQMEETIGRKTVADLVV